HRTTTKKERKQQQEPLAKTKYCLWHFRSPHKPVDSSSTNFILCWKMGQLFVIALGSGGRCLASNRRLVTAMSEMKGVGRETRFGLTNRRRIPYCADRVGVFSPNSRPTKWIVLDYLPC